MFFVFCHVCCLIVAFGVSCPQGRGYYFEFFLLNRLRLFWGNYNFEFYYFGGLGEKVAIFVGICYLQVFFFSVTF